MACPSGDEAEMMNIADETSASHLGGYIIGRTIGCGTYSKVKVAYYLQVKKGKATDEGPARGQEILAVKIINKRQATKEFVTKFLPREMAILRMVNHQNIVRVRDLIENGDCVYIFMENCVLGDILEFITKEDAFPESRTRIYFSQLVSAVRYLHSFWISHRDIKCENIFLLSENQIKLGDFGFARFCYDEKTRGPAFSHTFCGSTAYAAPEVLSGSSYDPMKTDIWSLGIVLYILSSATMPFADSDVPAMILAQQRRQLVFFPSISEPLRDLLRFILEPCLHLRPTTEQILFSDWFNFTTSPTPNDESTPSRVSEVKS